VSIPFDLWGQRGWAGAEVAGESHYAQQLRSLFGEDFKPSGTEIQVAVQLIPEPTNKFDGNAVGVWSGSAQWGYLPREDAARYVSVLSALVSRGWIPQVSARVWAHEIVEQLARSTRDVVEVRIDGVRVGQLTPKMSTELLPAIRHLAVRGEATGARAIVKGNRIKSEVVLYVARPLTSYLTAGSPTWNLLPLSGPNRIRERKTLPWSPCAGCMNPSRHHRPVSSLWFPPAGHSHRRVGFRLRTGVPTRRGP
jgi:hypothetical protein